MSADLAPQVEVRFGDSWTDHVEYLLRLADHAETPLDLRCVRDVIDIVVGGDNLTADLGEDGIFLVLADLLAGLDSLLAGTRTKVLLSFHEAPWEIALDRRGEDVAISLYSVLPGGEVAVHDRTAPLRQVTAATVRAADLLVAQLKRIRPDLASDPLLQVPARVRAHEASLQPAPPEPPCRDRHALQSGAFRLEIELGHAALAQPNGPPMDLHALLAPGTLRWSGREGDLTLGTGHPIRTLRGLVADLRDIVALVSGAQPRPVRRRRRALPREIKGAGTVVQLHPEGLFVRPTKRVDASAGQSAALAEVLAATTDLVERLCRDLIDAHPAQARNARLSALRADARQLDAWFQEVVGGDLRPTQSPPSASPHAVTVWTANPAVGGVAGPFSLVELRRVQLNRSWSLRTRGPGQPARRVGSRVLVPEEGGTSCLDLETGEKLWSSASLPADATPSLWFTEASTWRVTGSQTSRVTLESGLGWTTPSSFSGNAQGGATFDVPTGERSVIARAGGLECLDADGTTVWAVAPGHGSVRGFGATGTRAVFGSDRGFVYGVDLGQADIVWRSRVCAGTAAPVLSPGQPLLVGCTAPFGLLRLDPSNGVQRWSTGLRAAPRALLAFGETTIVRTDHGLGCIRHSDGALKWWAAMEDPSLIVEDDQIYATTDQGFSRLDPETGDSLWTVYRPVSHLTPAGPDVVAVATEDGVSLYTTDGQHLHELDGLPPSASWLRVGRDLRFLVGERDEDAGETHVSCYELGYFLAVVRS